MKLFNSAVTGFFDFVCWPFARLAPLLALTVISVLTGILMLWIFGLVSNQDAIRTIRDRIRGNLIAVRLFGDDLGLLFRLQGRLLKDNVVFLKYAMVPLLILIVPVLLIIVQLNLRFAATPLEPGDATLLKVTLRDGAGAAGDISLEVPDGVTVETPAVRATAAREVAWRIRSTEPGKYDLMIHAGSEAVAKELRVGEGWGAVSTLRTGKNLWDMLLYPGEAPLRSETIESIEIKYDPLDLSLFGWGVNWLIFFFLLSIIAGFAFRRVLGVEI